MLENKTAGRAFLTLHVGTWRRWRHYPSRKWAYCCYFPAETPPKTPFVGQLQHRELSFLALAVVRSTLPFLVRYKEILEVTLLWTWTHLQVWTKVGAGMQGEGGEGQGPRTQLPCAVPSPHPPGHAETKVRQLPQPLPGRARRARGAGGRRTSRSPAPSSRLSRRGLASPARAPEPRPACCSSGRPAKEGRRKGGEAIPGDFTLFEASVLRHGRCHPRGFSLLLHRHLPPSPAGRPGEPGQGVAVCRRRLSAGSRLPDTAARGGAEPPARGTAAQPGRSPQPDLRPVLLCSRPRALLAGGHCG